MSSQTLGPGQGISVSEKSKNKILIMQPHTLGPRAVQNHLQGQLSMKAINSGSWLSKIGPTSLQITFLGPIRPL